MTYKQISIFWIKSCAKQQIKIDCLSKKREFAQIRIEHFETISGMILKQSQRKFAANLKAEVRRSFITTAVRDESQVTPQGRHR